MTRLLLLTVAATMTLAPATPAAAAPPNDNYLASTRINTPGGPLPRLYHDAVDTSTASVQGDLFGVDKDGAPLGGGPPEMTRCGQASYGKTVWYDFVPPSAGIVQILASGYDAMVRVYEWAPSTSQITRTVLCHNTSAGPTEEVLMQRQIRRGASYTVQVGGVNDVGGLLDFRFTFFPDTDGDEVVDENPDRCRTLRGIAAFGGCPPVVSGKPRIGFDRLSAGLQITRLVVDRLAGGAKVSASCGRCGRSVSTTARRSGSLRIGGFIGRRVPIGDAVSVRITQRARRSGRYRHGAIGRLLRYPVRRDERGRPTLGRQTESCLAPGSTTKKMRCP